MRWKNSTRQAQRAAFNYVACMARSNREYSELDSSLPDFYRHTGIEIHITRCSICVDTYLIIVQTTLTLDDDLLAAAERYIGLKEMSALVSEALRALIEREGARRLAALGGSEPALKPVARRKTSA